jgi:hypothetical protein
MGTLLEKTRHKGQSEALRYGAECLEDGHWIRVYSDEQCDHRYPWVVEVRSTAG